ncbi:MAG: polyribonucleotide nucleotidyltransferase [candidate division Zixibacteria bacterium]
MEIYELKMDDGRVLSLETGRMARQAGGAVLVRLGDTLVLTAATSSESYIKRDFLALSVDYREKSYAAGKIPGGFFKREGRPSEKEILSARLTDRPLRPLFPDDFPDEIQVMIQVLSSDQENDADILGIIGASAALAISSIPFQATIGAVRVGRVDGKLVANPLFSDLEQSDINMIITGTPEFINMVEGGGQEISEKNMLEALEFGHNHIKKICAVIDEMKEKCGKPKDEFVPVEKDPELVSTVTEMTKEKIGQAIRIKDKSERSAAIKGIATETIEALAEKFPESEGTVKSVIGGIEKDDLRKMILDESVRSDGRGFEDIRDISIDVGALPRTHGSSLFTRGQTQALVTTTLGTKMDEQRVDDLLGESFKSFMLHYNFPPFSVGEVRPQRGPARREIGHGALAERAIEPVLPAEENFPYTIRIVSEVLESNGSSSMATVCGGSLALMDAGVPIKSPVAGIAMGLVMEGDKMAILTDILGVEDHLGDMDFKVAGTKDGITAFQMDIKIAGLTLDIMEKALAQANRARMRILETMSETLSTARTELSQYAPRIITFKVPVARIGEIIGPGGKMIRSIIETTGAKIDIEDDGTVLIASVDQAAGEAARDRVQGLIAEAELDQIYVGKVKRVAAFGAFIGILPNVDGLLHISEIDHYRVNRVEDVLNIGDEVKVKVINIDDEGKVRLSRKVLIERSESAGKDQGGRNGKNRR